MVLLFSPALERGRLSFGRRWGLRNVLFHDAAVCSFLCLPVRRLGYGPRQAIVLGVLAAGAPVCCGEGGWSMDEREGGLCGDGFALFACA